MTKAIFLKIKWPWKQSNKKHCNCAKSFLLSKVGFTEYFSDEKALWRHWFSLLEIHSNTLRPAHFPPKHTYCLWVFECIFGWLEGPFGKGCLFSLSMSFQHFPALFYCLCFLNLHFLALFLFIFFVTFLSSSCGSCIIWLFLVLI